LSLPHLFTFWQGLALARQELYLLSHAPSTPFCFSYFSDRISRFARESASDCDPPTYAFCIAGPQAWATIPGLLAEMGANFSTGLVLNYCLLDLWLLSSWDYRHESLHLAISLFCEIDQVSPTTLGLLGFNSQANALSPMTPKPLSLSLKPNNLNKSVLLIKEASMT
jgi:hypothetical protein